LPPEKEEKNSLLETRQTEREGRVNDDGEEEAEKERRRRRRRA
jgi:hypothetical protein